MRRCAACGRAVGDASGAHGRASCPWCGGALRDDPAGPLTAADALQAVFSLDGEAPYDTGAAWGYVLDLCPGLPQGALDSIRRAGGSGALPHLREGGDPGSARQALLAAGWGPAEADELVGAYLSLWPDGGRAWLEAEGRRRAEEERRRRDEERRLEEERRRAERKDIGLASVSGLEPSYPYTGRPVEPEPTVELGGRALVRGRDYLLSYHDNVGRPGAATRGSVWIDGVGGYRGSRRATFVIKPEPKEDIGRATVSGLESSYPYTGRPVEPEPTVELGGRALVRGRDYQITYHANVGTGSKPAVAGIHIVGIGEYEGSKYLRFGIVKSADPPKRTPAPPKRKSRLGSKLKPLGQRLPGAFGSFAVTIFWLVVIAVPVFAWVYQEWDNPFNRPDVEAVSAGVSHTVALLGDGTVAATGWNTLGQCDVSGWHDVVVVSAGGNHTVGLLTDGTVVATGENEGGQCDVSGWHDVTAVSAGDSHTVALLGDGTVVATGSNTLGQCDVSGWRDVVAVSAGWNHTVGLLEDGTVVATGSNYKDECDVSGWRDVTAVSAGGFHTVGLLEDGTVVATGDNDHGQCHVSSWLRRVRSDW